MKHIIIILCGFTFLVPGLSAQSTIDVTPSGMKYYMDGERLKKKDFERLYQDTESWEPWMKARAAKDAYNMLGGVGGFGIGWFLGFQMRPKQGFNTGNFRSEEELKSDRKTANFMGIGGLAFTLASIPFLSKNIKFSRKASGIYNDNLSTKSHLPPCYKIRGGTSGLSLSYNF